MGTTTPPHRRSKRVSKQPVIRVVQIHNPVYVHTDALNFPSLVQKLTGKMTPFPLSPFHSPSSLVPLHESAHPPHLRNFSAFDEVARPPAHCASPPSADDDYSVSRDMHDFSRRDENSLWQCSDGYGAAHWSRNCHGFRIPAQAVEDSRICGCRDDEYCGRSCDNENLDRMRRAFVVGETRSPEEEAAGYGGGHCAIRSCRRFRSMESSFYEESLSPNHSDDCLGSTDQEVEEGDEGYGDDLITLDMESFSELDIWAGLNSDKALPDITMLPPLLF